MQDALLPLRPLLSPFDTDSRFGRPSESTIRVQISREGGGGRVKSASQAALPLPDGQSFVSLCPLLTRLSIVPYLGRGPPPLTAALALDMPTAAAAEEMEDAAETTALCGRRACAPGAATECRWRVNFINVHTENLRRGVQNRGSLIRIEFQLKSLGYDKGLSSVLRQIGYFTCFLKSPFRSLTATGASAALPAPSFSSSPPPPSATLPSVSLVGVALLSVAAAFVSVLEEQAGVVVVLVAPGERHGPRGEG